MLDPLYFRNLSCFTSSSVRYGFQICIFFYFQLLLDTFSKLTSITVSTAHTKIYPPLPTSVQPISITKTLLIVLTKNEREPPLFTGKLLIKFQNNSEKRYSSYHTTQGKNPIFRHIKSINSGTAKVKIVKNERDPPLFTSKQLIKF